MISCTKVQDPESQVTIRLHFEKNSNNNRKYRVEFSSIYKIIWPPTTSYYIAICLTICLYLSIHPPPYLPRRSRVCLTCYPSSMDILVTAEALISTLCRVSGKMLQPHEWDLNCSKGLLVFWSSYENSPKKYEESHSTVHMYQLNILLVLFTSIYHFTSFKFLVFILFSLLQWRNTKIPCNHILLAYFTLKQQCCCDNLLKYVCLLFYQALLEKTVLNSSFWLPFVPFEHLCCKMITFSIYILFSDCNIILNYSNKVPFGNRLQLK